MDPVTQGVLGASVPQAISQKKTIVAASLFGAVSGMAPDLDSLIRSDTDPLLYLEYHRQFSHSLIFIPVGSLICALVFYFLLARRWEISFKLTYLFCLLGYGTHGLLDACTSYGTQLLWPFSTERFAWNSISIVDPLFTLPLLVLVILGLRKKNHLYARIALGWVIIYQSLGFYQNYRVAEVGAALAQQRGHTPIRLEAKPSFGNLLLWKVVYQTENDFQVDGVRVGLTTRVFDGDSVPRLDLERDFPWLDHSSQQARDIERFRWFSNGYLAVDPRHPNRITDIRYSFLPNQVAGLWSIQLSTQAGAQDHVSYVASRDASEKVLSRFQAMLFE
jgi:inner membrane protein